MLLQKKYKDKSVIIISGNIKLLEEDIKHYDSRKSMKNLDIQLNQQQIYEIFKKNGYHMENCFASINHISYNNTGYYFYFCCMSGYFIYLLFLSGYLLLKHIQLKHRNRIIELNSEE